jgi:hypothetical protein
VKKKITKKLRIGSVRAEIRTRLHPNKKQHYYQPTEILGRVPLHDSWYVLLDMQRINIISCGDNQHSATEREPTRKCMEIGRHNNHKIFKCKLHKEHEASDGLKILI